MLLSLIYQAHPFDQLDEHRVVLAVIKYFSEHYAETFGIPSMAEDLGLPLIHVEIAFDDYKGRSANQALLEYRLNRLCDRMTKNPSDEIHKQIHECGLASFAKTNMHFIEQFGIDLVEFHQQCFLAAAARRQCERDRRGEAKDELVGAHSTSEYKATRFHRN